MTEEEAEAKAEQAAEMGIIEREQIEAYTQHLLEIRKVINNGNVDHEGATSIHSKQTTGGFNV